MTTTTQPTQRHLAKELNISPGRVSQLKGFGMPVESIEAAREWLRQRNEEIGRGTKAPSTLNDARLRKVLLECRILEMRVEAIEDVEHAPLAEMEQFIEDFCDQARWRFRLEAESLTTRIAGLPELECYTILRETFTGIFWHSVCAGMKDQNSVLAVAAKRVIAGTHGCEKHRSDERISEGITDAKRIAQKAVDEAQAENFDAALALIGEALDLIKEEKL